MEREVVVVGGGVVGVATAWRLAQRGCKVTVVEQFSAGHARGSSHGSTRICRSTYAQPVYSALVGLSLAEDWPELEAEADRTLLHRGGDAVVWGPEDGAIGAYAAASRGFDVESMTVPDAQRRFKGLGFPGAERVLWDRTAAVIAAADTMSALYTVCRARGVTFLEGVRVDSFVSDGAGVTLRAASVADGAVVLHADALVLAAGPWSARVAGVPAIPVRQDVGYWALPACRAGSFPCFIHLGGLGATGGAVHYGLPGLGEDVLKAAFHRTSGEADDPDVPRLLADPRALAAVEDRLREWFVGLGPLVRSETCFYSNTPTEDFVLDVVTSDGSVVVGGGLSGHGFKFGPLLGRILADLILTGTSTVAPFAHDRARFALR